MNRAKTMSAAALVGRSNSIMPDLISVVNTGLAYFVPFTPNRSVCLAPLPLTLSRAEGTRLVSKRDEG